MLALLVNCMCSVAHVDQGGGGGGGGEMSFACWSQNLYAMLFAVSLWALAVLESG